MADALRALPPRNFDTARAAVSRRAVGPPAMTLPSPYPLAGRPRAATLSKPRLP